MTPSIPNPPLELRLRVLSAIDYAPGDSLRERIKHVSGRVFTDERTGVDYRFTWRTIETWRYRFKKHGITTLAPKTRSDMNTHRKVQVNELAEAIHEMLPTLRFNKTGVIPKMALYRKLLAGNYFTRSQLSQTSFYRMVRQNDLIDTEQTRKLRQSFAMRYANELWQADTLHGPAIKQPDGAWKKTFQEILQACVRLDIHLSHAPVRDGAAKGKIERFFRGFRDRFLTQHLDFASLEDLNDKTHHWIENDYNSQYHSGIQMVPLDRFNLDRKRIRFLTDDETTEEVFFVEETRKVSKTNVFSINNQKHECPVDLREKRVQVRYDRTRRDRFIVYFNDRRMGEALPLDLHFNAHHRRPSTDASSGEPA